MNNLRLPDGSFQSWQEQKLCSESGLMPPSSLCCVFRCFSPPFSRPVPCSDTSPTAPPHLCTSWRSQSRTGDGTSALWARSFSQRRNNKSRPAFLPTKYHLLFQACANTIFRSSNFSSCNKVDPSGFVSRVHGPVCYFCVTGGETLDKASILCFQWYCMLCIPLVQQHSFSWAAEILDGILQHCYSRNIIKCAYVIFLFLF